MTNRDAYIALNLLPGIGPIRVNHLLTHFGDPCAILRAPEAELCRIQGIGPHFAGLIAHRQPASLQDELQRCERAGVRIITREDAAYPAILREIHDPPLCLYLRGEEKVFSRLRQAVAMVGSRHTTSYGIAVADNLATAAAMAGWTVVSGLARGIDTVAHQAVVRMHGCTIAVLGSGLGHIYPQDNIELARAIVAEGGALVSEFPLMFPPDKRSFPMRNRIISGLTQGTIVVEAGTKSGSLITAGQALEQGRAVFAVPGRVDSPQSRGCHALIKDGARLVESFTDVLEEFNALPGLGRSKHVSRDSGALFDLEALDAPAPETAALAAEDLTLSELERNILTYLELNGEAVIDDVVTDLREPVAKLLGALVTLEIRHLVVQLPGKRVARRQAAVAG